MTLSAGVVHETAQNIGAGNVALLGAADAASETFQRRGVSGATPYLLQHRTSGQFEYGFGSFDGGTNALQRAVVVANSNGTTSLISFAVGIVDVWNDFPASKFLVRERSGAAYVGLSKQELR